MAVDSVNEDVTSRSANLRKVSRVLGLAISILGLLVMLGWIFNIPLFMRLHPALPSMKFNTSILFFLCGFGLWSLPADKRYKKLIPLPILVLASLTLSQYLFGWNLAIDQFFVVDTQTLGSAPGRMSFTTTLSFIAFAIGLSQIEQRPQLTQLCAIVIGIPSMIVLAGYVYNVPDLYRVFIFSTIALHTAIASLALATALILADDKSQFMQMILSESAGAKLIRQTLPLSLLFLLAVDSLFILGVQIGLYPVEFVWPLNIIASLGAVITMFNLVARDWHETDLRRIVAEEQLKIYNESLEELVQERTEEIRIYQAAIEASSDLIVVVDRNHRYVLANNAHLKYNQRERHEIIHHQVSEILGEDVFQKLKVYYDKCFAGESVTFEQAIHFPSYGLRYLLINYSPLRNRSNEVMAVAVVAHDITERKSLENILTESEEKLTTLFDVLPVGVSLLNKEGQLVQTNRMLEKITGLTMVDLLQAKHLKRQYIHYDGSPMLPDEFPSRQAIRNQSPVLDVEMGIIKENGETVWTSVSASPLTHADLSAVVVTLDISRRKEAEMQLRQLDAERQRVKILHDFIHAASHDLKTPITQIITTLYLLQKSSNDEQQLLRLNKLENYIKHLNSIVQALLQMSELDLKESSEGGRMDLNEILRDLLPIYTAKAQKKNQKLVFTQAENPLYVNVDGRNFYMALQNILQNALDYTPEAGTIHVSSYPKDSENVIEVSDSGMGIEEADLAHIFEHFYRADKARSVGEGHIGMGLALAQKIIQKHHGRIEVLSQVNQGSRFYIFMKALAIPNKSQNHDD